MINGKAMYESDDIITTWQPRRIERKPAHSRTLSNLKTRQAGLFMHAEADAVKRAFVFFWGSLHRQQKAHRIDILPWASKPST